MTVPLSLPRLGRPAVAAAASIALTATALLAPHAASAHASSPASPQFCVSAPVSDLASWGYAVQRTGTSGWGYYAAGSNDDLGSSGSAIKSLAKRSVGVWTRVPLCS